MGVTDIQKQQIKKIVGELCRKRSPESTKDQYRTEYEIDGQSVILFEVRSVWDDPSQYIEAPFAKLTYVGTRNEWQLFWQRADMKWHRYVPLAASKDLRVLVNEIEKDPHYCFFG